MVRPPSPLRALVFAALLGAAFAPAARADIPGPALDRGASAAERAEAWKGRVCTPLSCAPRAASPLAALAGFGLAVAAAARLSRRDRA